MILQNDDKAHIFLDEDFTVYSILTQIDAQQVKKTVFHWLYQPYKWLVFLPTVLISTNLVTLFIAIARGLGMTKRLWLLPMLWARINTLVTPVKVTVSGREHIQPGRSYVVVANHLSHFDILAVYGWLGIDFRWVMKQELRKVPALGYACVMLGHVYIDRSNPEAAKRSIDSAKHQLNNGTSIFFFPEGTRSVSGEMLPFKKGAFHLAKELGLPILPITIRGTHEILPANSLNLSPGTAELQIHAPIAVHDETDTHTLMQQARDVIRSGLIHQHTLH